MVILEYASQEVQIEQDIDSKKRKILDLERDKQLLLEEKAQLDESIAEIHKKIQTTG